jgi:serine/threonine-protein kinase
MEDAVILEAQGNLEGALSIYLRTKQWSNAARLSLRLDRPLEAAKLYLEAQQPYDAAVCFQKAQALKECLEALLQVSVSSSRYRLAGVHAIRVAVTLGEPINRLTPFIVPFINSAPTTPVEAAAFNQFAHALVERDKQRQARTVYRRVLEAFPDNADAKEALAALPATQESLPAAQSNDPFGTNPSLPTVNSGIRATPLNSPAVVSVSVTTAPSMTAAARSPSGGGNATTPHTARPPTTERGTNKPRPPTAERVPKGQKLAEILLARGKVTSPQLQLVQKRGAFSSDLALGEALVAEGWVTDLDVIRALSEQSGIPYIGEKRLLASASDEAAKTLSTEQVERWTVVPMALIDKHLYVAMRDPRNIALIDQVRFASGVPQVSGVFATDLSIRKAIRKLYYNETQTDDEAEDWRGRVFDPVGTGGLAPFSDRFTKTREHEFNTQEMMLRLMADTNDGAPPAMSIAPVSSATMARPLDHAQSMTASPPIPAPTVAPEPGQVFAGRYRIEAEVGQGGSATVYRALDLELNELVAVKIFRLALQIDTLLARFKLELSLARQLTHPNIIRLFDMGTHEGFRYLTMEYLEGSDLASRLLTLGKPLPVIEGLRYLEQACMGLQAAHDCGVVHRDVKPHNLFVTTSGQVKLMDFGIAKKERTHGVTVAGMIAGTPEYMSPEQINDFSNVTHLSDLYALGATAYVMFTGSPPFNQPEVMAVLMAHVNTPAPSPRLRNPAIPPELEAAILRLLEKDPARRFGSARELADVVRQIRQSIEATPHTG